MEFCNSFVSEMHLEQFQSLTIYDRRHGSEQRLCKQVNETDLTLCLRFRVGRIKCHNRDWQAEVCLDRGLYSPFVQQSC